MTLRKNEKDKEWEEVNSGNVIKMEKVLANIKELAIYLGQYPIVRDKGWTKEFSRKISNIEEYDRYVIYCKRERITYKVVDKYHLCVTAGNGDSINKYVRMIVENIFPCHKLYLSSVYPREKETEELISYGGNPVELGLGEKVPQNDSEIEDFEKRICSFYTFRDDLKYGDYGASYSMLLKCMLERINEQSCIDYYWQNAKYYNIFWNIFLLTVDDEIYESQLNNVAELAAYFNFDEAMMRDWCRAVEYVLAGNEFSKDCDFECETVEGLKFFLHRDE